MKSRQKKKSKNNSGAVTNPASISVSEPAAPKRKLIVEEVSDSEDVVPLYKVLKASTKSTTVSTSSQKTSPVQKPIHTTAESAQQSDDESLSGGHFSESSEATELIFSKAQPTPQVQGDVTSAFISRLICMTHPKISQNLPEGDRSKAEFTSEITLTRQMLLDEVQNSTSETNSSLASLTLS
ncbi:hypothetical protein F511_05415 [Dorcoceras hygrometricum]|uniref:Uncharacterized protein n=1 Tax=Dorcoceras hygrometricum TaxID=472368 RepID=A0A2Z7BG17_9LAMI|nr:hypothetical protein F511_05415 [Dorcoceras hygrometricum]